MNGKVEPKEELAPEEKALAEEILNKYKTIFYYIKAKEPALPDSLIAQVAATANAAIYAMRKEPKSGLDSLPWKKNSVGEWAFVQENGKVRSEIAPFYEDLKKGGIVQGEYIYTLSKDGKFISRKRKN